MIRRINQKILFKILPKLILKYFPEGVTKIFALDKNGIETSKVIAYSWAWKKDNG